MAQPEISMMPRHWIHYLVLFCVAILFSSCAITPAPSIHLDTGLISASCPSSQQIIQVLKGPKGSLHQAQIVSWEKKGTSWKKVYGPWPAVIGRGGFADDNSKMEGDGKTPSGIFSVGMAFGKNPRIKTGLTYRPTTEKDLWIDDILSPQYNQWVSSPTTAASFELMRRTDELYDLGAVIEYNTSLIIPGKGSAIFLHIWRDNGHKPTSGCVAASRKHLSRILAWLNKEMNPVIILNPASS